MKKILKLLIVFIIVVCLLIVGGYFYFTSAPSKSNETVNIYVSEGESYSSIASLLNKNGLIKSELAYKIFIKLNTPTNNLEYGDYILSTSSDLNELIKTLEKGSVNLAETISVTFIEGKNMRYFISTVTEKFNITEDEILDVLKDKTYLKSLINNYWFLTDDILNDNIYYSLEGYLYPDTYEFYSSATIKNIIVKMLDNMNLKLESYKNEIESNKYSIHEIITLASIIELESSGSEEDRKNVSGVFMNRLNDNSTLGSDVTTYYGSKVDLWSRDLYKSELNDCSNGYNTNSACSSMAGKLPVGPICNPSIDSLIASIEPNNHDYYFFVSDKNGKLYFNKTDSGHNSTINELRNEGLWFEYSE